MFFVVFYAHGYPRFEARRMKNIVVAHFQKNRFFCMWEVVVAFGTSGMEALLYWLVSLEQKKLQTWNWSQTKYLFL